MLLLDILLVQLSSCPLSSCFKRHWICFRHWIGYLEIKAPHTTVTTYQFNSHAADQLCCWWEARLLSLPRIAGSTECLDIGKLYTKGSISFPLQQYPLCHFLLRYLSLPQQFVLLSSWPATSSTNWEAFSTARSLLWASCHAVSAVRSSSCSTLLTQGQCLVEGGLCTGGCQHSISQKMLITANEHAELGTQQHSR